MDNKPPLRSAILAMERLLRSPHAGPAVDWAVQIRSCLIWAMDLDRFGATRTDLGELRQGLMSVCRFIRATSETDSDGIVSRVYSVAEALPRI